MQYALFDGGILADFFRGTDPVEVVASFLPLLILLLIGLPVGYVIFRHRYPREPLPPSGPARTDYRKGTFCFALTTIFLLPAGLLYFFKDALAVLVPELSFLSPTDLWILVMILILLGALCIYRGRQYRGRARIPNLTGPTILFLRSFTQDPSLLKHVLLAAWRSNPFSATVQEQLALAIKPLGELVAIGNPREKFPTPGGFRMYERDEDWQKAVIRMMQDAKAVIVQASRTPGLLWEMGECRDLVQPQRLVILVHKLSRKDYEHFSESCCSRHHLVLPSYDRSVRRGGLIFFASDWTPSFRELKAPFWRCPIMGRRLQAQLTEFTETTLCVL